MNNIVCIGAGQTGRGYINRFFKNELIVFLDKDEDLINTLNNTEEYKISFSGSREAMLLNNYKAYHINSRQGFEELLKANLIVISVGQKNVKDLYDILHRTVLNSKQKSIDILVCENGINVKEPLVTLEEDCRVHIAEAIIFCTTIKKENSLDIFSEDLDFLPYDVVSLGHELPYLNMVPEPNLNVLMQRKIYTYNCISAIITYLGYFKGYDVYSEAANDEDINLCVQNIVHGLNKCICAEYNVSEKEQEKFSNMAIMKFKNNEIFDTIERNARDVDRKLGLTERIMAPLSIMEKHEVYSNELLLVVACAIYYGQKTETLLKTVDEYIVHMPLRWQEKVKYFLNLLYQDFFSCRNSLEVNFFK